MAMGADIRRSFAATAAALAAVLFAPPADGSELVGRNATNVQLQVDARGRAAVTFHSEGTRKTLVAWGAVDARPPSRSQPQVAFQLQFGAPVGPNVCRSYSGPPLAWLVKACTAPDGTHWALQSWQRMLPNYGVAPTPERAAWELRLSHWRGELPVLEIWTDWSYRRFHHLWGRLTYKGVGVFGFAATRFGMPLDAYGRNVFVDTFNSKYGPGWKRENSFLTHAPGGAFCYGFYPHGRSPGEGKKYRATVIGPGVTPDVSWEGPAPGAFDAPRDEAANAEQHKLLGGDSRCKIN